MLKAGNIKKRVCDKCNKEISLSNYNKHIKCCKGTENIIKIEDSWLQNNGLYKCPYCNKDYHKKGLGIHIWRNHTENGKNFDPNIGYKNGTRKGCNKGKILSEETKLKISNSNKGKGHPHTEETKLKLSKAAIKNNLGGHTSKKAIHYKQVNGNIVYLQSDYETQVAKSLDENNIKWIRPEPLMWIDKFEKQHRYYPDFYLIDYNVYLDPKNDFLIKKDKNKIKLVSEQNNVIILIIDKDNLKWDNIKNIINNC